MLNSKSLKFALKVIKFSKPEKQFPLKKIKLMGPTPVPQALCRTLNGAATYM
jgi:hypothetical protein